jgi:hypothetical protein
MPKKYYKFSELDDKAKKKAVKHYLKGWEETHPKGDMSYEDGYSSCHDCDDESAFDITGKYINEFEELEED